MFQSASTDTAAQLRRVAVQCLHTETHLCRHSWAAATSGVQAMGFSRAGIGVFVVAALGFLGAGIGVFVVAAFVF